MVRKVTLYSIIGLFRNDYRKTYYLREIAAELGKPHQTIKPYLNQLVERKVLIEERKKKITLYKLNLDNESAFSYVYTSEIEALFTEFAKSQIMHILYEKLIPFFDTNSFIIFGSAAEEVKKDSDIDLLVIGKGRLNEAIAEFEQIYHKKIHLIQIGHLDKLSLSLGEEVFKKHIIFNDTEKIVRFFRGING